MRAKKSFKNIFFNVIQQIVGIITGFILPPLIIKTFGSAINGLISTIKEFSRYAQIAGYGIASATTYALYKPLSNKEEKNISGIYNACRKSFIKAGNVVALIMGIVAVIYPIFMGKELNWLTIFLLIIIISSWGLSEFYLIGKYQALLTADQKNYLVAIAQAVGNIFNIVITMVLIKLKFNIVIVQIGATAVYLTRILILTFYVKKHYKYLDKKVKPMFDKINQRKAAIIHEVTALVINSSSVVLVSFMLGLKQASIFSVYLLVFAGLNTVCSIFTTGVFASFGDVIAKKETTVLKKSYNIFEWGYLLMVFVIYTITFILIMPFISIYTKNIIDVNYYLPLFGGLFVILGVINNIKIPARTIQLAAGKYEETKKYSIIELIINIVAQIIGILLFGIYGALIGCIISNLYRTINYIWYTNKKIINIDSKRTIKRILCYSVLSIIFLISFNKLVVINPNTYISLIFQSVIVSIVVGLVYIIFSILIDYKTFIDAKNTIKRIIAKTNNFV